MTRTHVWSLHPSIPLVSRPLWRHASVPLGGSLAIGALLWGALMPTLAAAQAAERLAPPAASVEDASLAPPPGPSWHVDVSASTSFPLSIGGQLQVEAPFGLLLLVEGGYVPSAYLGAGVDVLASAGVLEPQGRALADEAVSSGGWNVRLSAGYVFGGVLEVLGGYTLLTTRSRVAARSLEAAVGQSLPPTGQSELPFSVTVHALHARVAFRIALAEHWLLRLGLGWTHEVGNRVGVDLPPAVAARPEADELLTRVRRGLGTYGFTPEAIASFGYRF